MRPSPANILVDRFLKPAIMQFYQLKTTNAQFLRKSLTPRKTNMEPENGPLEKEIPIGNHENFQVPAVEFRGCKKSRQTKMWHRTWSLFLSFAQFPKQNDVGNNWSWPHGCKLNVAPRTSEMFWWEKGSTWKFDLHKLLPLIGSMGRLYLGPT